MKGATPKDEYLHVRGVRLHYLDWGNQGQQPMLLLHGFLGHAHLWDDLALTLRDRYHVIALDREGMGKANGWKTELILSPIISQTSPGLSKPFACVLSFSWATPWVVEMPYSMRPVIPTRWPA